MNKIDLMKTFIKETLCEVLRSFNLDKFKSIAEKDMRVAHEYASKMLPIVGKGSSRVVYGLSGNKVLKVVNTLEGVSGISKGRAQNEAEIDVFTQPRTKNVITKVFDYDAFADNWLISEIVKPFPNRETFEKFIGMKEMSFANIISRFYKSNLSIEKYFKQLIKKAKHNIHALEKAIVIANNSVFTDEQKKEKLVHYESTINAQKKFISVLENILRDTKKLEFYDGLSNLVNFSDLLPGDLDRYDQYGTTVDGRIVLLDYGFTDTVFKKYYESAQYDSKTILTEGGSIVHVNNLSAQQLLDLLKQWNKDKTAIKVTEKIDGAPMSFGIGLNGKPFIRSKNKEFTEETGFPTVFFLEPFKRYFYEIRDIPLVDIVSDLIGKEVTSLEIIGEAVPHHQHNVVLYDQAKIGKGIFVIFGLKVNDKTVGSPELYKELANKLNQAGVSQIKFYGIPEVNVGHIKFDQKWLITLEELFEKYGNVLAKQARQPHEKEIKEKVAAIVSSIGMKLKKRFSVDVVGGEFGPEIEGFVLQMPNGNLIKIVDQETFTKRGTESRVYLKQMEVMEKTFAKDLAKNPKSIRSLLKALETQLNDLEKEFEGGAYKKLIIPLKVEETRKNIALIRDRIEKIKNFLRKGMSPEEISQKLSTRTLYERRILKEGGAATGANTLVPRELLDHNVSHAIKTMFGSKMDYALIGNISKDFLGDIDVAIDKEGLMRLVEVVDPENKDLYRKIEALIKKRIPNVVLKSFPGLQMISVALPLLDKNNNQLPVIDRSTQKTVPNTQGIYQIDLMIGNVGYLKKSMSGAGKGSLYKAVYRNLLLMEIFAHLIWKDKKDPTIMYKFDAGTKEGIRLVKFVLSPAGKREKIGKSVVVSTDLDYGIEKLFGPGVKFESVDTFEKLYSLFTSKKFKYPEIRNKVIEGFKKNIISSKLELPKEIS